MNEKRNHLHSFAHFSGLFHNFPRSLTIFWHLSLRKSKNILFSSYNSLQKFNRNTGFSAQSLDSDIGYAKRNQNLVDLKEIVKIFEMFLRLCHRP